MALYSFQCAEHGEFTELGSPAAMPASCPCPQCGVVCLREAYPASQMPPREGYVFKLMTSEGPKLPDDPKRKGPRIKG